MHRRHRRLRRQLGIRRPRRARRRGINRRGLADRQQMRAAQHTFGCAALIFVCVITSAVAADLRRATLQPTYTLDLESGSVGGLGPTVDLFWQAKTRSDRCLGPMFNSRALLAPLAASEFDKA